MKKKIIEKLKTLIWFLKKPTLYPQLFYQLKQTILPHSKENTSNESKKWCQYHSISSSEAIEKITGKKPNKSFKEVYRQEVEWANEKSKIVPIRMGGPGDLDLLFYIINNTESKIIVESGVAYGWSSLAILLALEEKEDSILYSSDMPYAKMDNEPYVGCVIPERLKKKWHLIRVPDRQAIPLIFKEIKSIDLFHYDSDKSYRGRMWAYPKIWSHLKSGGIFISDDIDDNIAFKDFSSKFNIEPIVVSLGKKHVGIMKKPI